MPNVPGMVALSNRGVPYFCTGFTILSARGFRRVWLGFTKVRQTL